jgi:hypothetical protein
MNSMRSGSQSNVSPAVNQNPAVGAATQRDYLTRYLEQPAVGKILLPYLNKVHTPGNSPTDARGQ